MRRSVWAATIVAMAALSLSGCGLFSSDEKSAEQKRAEEDKTRDEVAKATERVKPELKEAGRELKEGAKTLAEQAHAAAQGAKEGWQKSGHETVDLNSASEGQLESVPGVTRRTAQRIIAGRPYKDAHDLVDKGVLPESKYEEIRDHVVAR